MGTSVIMRFWILRAATEAHDNDERTRVAALGRSPRVQFRTSLSLSATPMRALALPGLDGRSACDGR